MLVSGRAGAETRVPSMSGRSRFNMIGSLIRKSHLDYTRCIFSGNCKRFVLDSYSSKIKRTSRDYLVPWGCAESV